MQDAVDQITKFLIKNPVCALILPVLMGTGGFFTNLIVALDDGTLDTVELHQLLSGANGVQTVVLICIMVLLKNQQRKR